MLDADPTRLAQVLLEPAEQRRQVHGPRRPHLADWPSGRATRSLVRVKDTGIGIPAEMLPRIFEMFTQVRTLAGAVPGRARHRLDAGAAAGRDARRHGRGQSDGLGQGQRVRRAPAGRRRRGTSRPRPLGAGPAEPAHAGGRAASSSWTTTAMRPTAWACCCG